jgi:uncharacterized membrane protein (UPF0127 family)
MSTGWQFVEAESGRLLVPSVEVADTFWSRLRGLQFRRALSPGEGLLLVPCASIHTCFVRFSLDVVMLSRQWQVLAVRRRVRAWRLVIAPQGTHAVLEMYGGSAPEVFEGMRLKLESAKK